VIPGGTGQVGTALRRALRSAGYEVTMLTRGPVGDGLVSWDGERLGPWAREIDGSDVVINLAGRSVSCRYTKGNLTEMMRSRVRATRVVGQAIAAAARPPAAWLQMSTATIYAHTYGAANDDVTGVIGGSEEGVPGFWAFSVDICPVPPAARRSAIPGASRGWDPEGEWLQGVSSNAASPLVASEPLATIWPLSLIALALLTWSPAGMRLLRSCTAPPLSIEDAPTITPLSLIAFGQKLLGLLILPLL
jgi:NAD dependent epimerase/dehydratase family